MKIISCYKINNKKNPPKREIITHLTSYQINNYQNVFYSNFNFENYLDKSNINFRLLNIDIDLNPFYFKHICIKTFFKDYPNDDDVLYVDTDTFCNDYFQLKSFDSLISMVKYSKGNRQRYNSGVVYVKREFVHNYYIDFLKILKGKIKNNESLDDEKFLTIFIKENNIKVKDMDDSMNYGIHKAKRFIKSEFPKILHFHLNQDIKCMIPFISENLLKIITQNYFIKGRN